MTEHERRFLLARAVAEAFVLATTPWLTLQVYDLARPLAYSRTTYFDDDRQSYLRSCDAPVAQRLRLREYAAAAGPGDVPRLTGDAFLELKESRGPNREKVRVAAPAGVLCEWIDRRGEPPPLWARRLEDQAGFAVVRQRLQVDHLRPCVLTWYRRVSLSGHEGHVRVTMDEGLSFSRPEPVGAIGDPAAPAYAVDHLPGRVLEIKTHGPPPDWLGAAAAGLSPADSFSKFRRGMLAVRQDGARATHRTTPLEIPNPATLVKKA